MDLVCALWLGLQALAQAPEQAPPVSLERIRRGLEEPAPTVTMRSNDPNLPPIFRLEVRERRLAFEHLWDRDWVPSYVQPSRTYYHLEFLASVTPDLFRSTSMYPCCDIEPLIRLFRKNGASKQAESKARLEVKKAHAEYLAALERAGAAQKDDKKD